MKKIKVLHVGMSYGYGGIESFIESYLNEIDSNKVQIDILNVFECAQKEEFYKRLNDKTQIHNLPNYRTKPFQFIRELKKLNKKEKYDVFHYNMNSAVYLIPLLAAKLCGIKVIISHSHNSANDKGFLKTILHNLNRHFIPLLANVYFACSDKAGEWFYNKKITKSDKYYVIKNAINTKKYEFNEEVRKLKRKELELNDSTIVLGNVGRFKKQKNHDYLIDIFYEYQKNNSNTKLLLVGIGPLQDEIKQKVKSLNIDDKVVFLGQRKDVNELMQAMDIFILPSLYEGLPLVGIEAQSAGLPCLFSDTITRELEVTDNVKYIPLNDVMKWKDALINIENNNDRKKMRQLVVNDGYDINESSSRLVRIYDKVVNYGGKNKKH